jgi:hypothetical protein
VTLRADVEALAAMTRDSAGAGERAAAAWLADRLRAAGAQDVRVEPYRSQGTYAWIHAAHAAVGLLAAARGGRAGAALALAALVSLELEGSGRCQWLRRGLPAGEGANVVARVPARGRRERTIVLAAHHDAARTGLAWDPRIRALEAGRNARRRRIDGFLQPVAAALGMAALPWRPARAAGAAVLALAAALDVDIARSPTVPGANDNATGVAALIALAAEPLDGTEVILVSTGCEESGMGGMRAFLRAHAHELDPGSTLVLGLDTLGSGVPAVVAAEGVIRTHRYREEDLALVPAEAERWRIGGWTDPVLARFAGLPALCLISFRDGWIPNYHRLTDTPERVDYACVERCVELARATARAFSAR